METSDVTGGLAVTRSLTIPSRALQWRFSRAGGPGGQKVDTTDSRVELSVLLYRVDNLTAGHKQRIRAELSHRIVDGALVVVAAEHRSQLRNRQAVRERAAGLLHEALTAPPPHRRKSTKPSRRAVQRRLDVKKQRGRTKALRRRPDY